MKSFPSALALYTVIVLALSLVLVHFTFAKPLENRLSSLDTSLEGIETDIKGELNTLGYQLEAINTKLSLRQPSTQVDVLESKDAQDELAAINQNIDSYLAQTAKPTHLPGIGGTATPLLVPTAISVRLAIKTYTISSLKAFAQPDLQSDVVGTLSYGDLYSAIGQTTDWYQVKLNSQTTGWVQAEYVKEID